MIPRQAVNLGLRLLVKRRLARETNVERLRVHFDDMTRRTFAAPDDTYVTEETIVPSGNRGEPVRSLWIAVGRPDRRRLLLYFHGGAYVAGSPESHRHLGARLARASGSRCVLPAYRLAPEHPFPAALDDALGIYRALLERGYEASDIVIGGDSAGGGLTFALALSLAEAGEPMPAALVALSPWTDLTGSGASLIVNAKRDAMLPADRLGEVAEMYHGAHDPRDPRISPVFATWTNPPPALIVASKDEILTDDSVRLAEALRAGGGDVMLDLWPRMPHAFPMLAGLLKAGDRSIETIGAFIRRHQASGART